MDFVDKRFGVLCLGLLAIQAALQISSVSEESQNYDEAVHLAAGYSYLKTGDFRLNREHPALGKMLNAVPLLFLNVRLPLDDPSWTQADQWTFGKVFLYQNRVPADTMLRAARLVTILLTLLLGASIAIWTRRRFGAPAALVALSLYALDPNIIAHGRYVTTDLIAALFLFLTCTAWLRFLETDRRRDLLLTGLLLGLALLSKYSSVILAPLLAILYGIHRWGRWRRSIGHAARSLAIVYGLSAFLVLALYAPGGLNPSRHMYLLGLWRTYKLNSVWGQPAYLLGQRSNFGWWYYFPVAFAVKTPLGALLLLLPGWWWTCRRRIRFEQVALAVPAALYFAWSMTSHINIGVRHILPIYPLLFALMGAALFQSPLTALRRGLLAAALALQAFECVRIYPHYTSFFNQAAGGPATGARYLLDSNLDWGQDAKRLAGHLRSQGIREVCDGYFGKADLGYYGIATKELPSTGETGKLSQLDCVAAVSVNHLHGLYLPPPKNYDWLRAIPPTSRVGYSIYLYDLRKKPPQ